MIQRNAKIVIASVLKPVDDVRNYEKIGCSLAKEDSLEVHILGTIGKVSDSKISAHLWKPFRRLSFGRLMIQFHYLKKLRVLKPDLLIVTTHELLLASVLLKAFFSTKIIYDVQEDYFKNLWHQHFYPPVLRHVMAI
ncbi:MAG: glycosyltransferase, partial [Cyclobacteriaceae bacterium]